MKTIGIVGGLAWPSTITYYKIINERIARRMGDGGLHCAKLVLIQTDFQLIEHYERTDRWDLVGELVSQQGHRLKAAGADFFLLACNTAHIVSEQIEAAVDLPFLHIVDPTARQVLAGGFKTVGLLGSRYTMAGTYFRHRLEQRYGLRVLVPDTEQQEFIDTALFTELAKGLYRPETRAGFRTAMAALAASGAEVIILGCTEFGLLVGPGDSPVPVIDTAVTHAEAAADMALDEA